MDRLTLGCVALGNTKYQPVETQKYEYITSKGQRKEIPLKESSNGRCFARALGLLPFIFMQALKIVVKTVFAVITGAGLFSRVRNDIARDRVVLKQLCQFFKNNCIGEPEGITALSFKESFKRNFKSVILGAYHENLLGTIVTAKDMTWFIERNTDSEPLAARFY